MARTKAEGESKSQIFRRYFDQRPDLLRVPSFDEVIAMYQKEFPDRDFSDSDRQIAANIKSKLRKEKKIGRRRRRRRHAAAAVGVEAHAAPRAARSNSALAALEDQIDDCLMTAKRLDREGLEDVIKHLRRARNLVVVRTGES
jgi:hypothetical protein